jgi:hypothetical protein
MIYNTRISTQARLKASTTLSASLRTLLNVPEFDPSVARCDLAWTGGSVAASLRTFARSSISLRSLDDCPLGPGHPTLARYCGEQTLSTPTQSGTGQALSHGLFSRYRLGLGPNQRDTAAASAVSASPEDGDGDVSDDDDDIIVRNTMDAPTRRALIAALEMQHNPMIEGSIS